jgi:preprotein translocase subunit SecE
MAKKKKEVKQRPKENAIVRYFRETRIELRKVHWPSRQEAWDLTKLVLIVTVAMALFMGLLDYLFSLELRGLVAGSGFAIGAIAVVVVAGIVLFVVLSRQSA